MEKFGAAVISAQWDHITLQGETGPGKVSPLALFHPHEVMRVVPAVDRAESPEHLRKLL